ncbi:LPS export ABC transporter periplasmic protein LptC [uncultured Luteimonas sp.]|uniref:LPS export ABC transporter periplasmic protein LptC n=1 Tax=uncultured Luteimonas sp. TaxID=453144 RepID=UPI00260EE13A|nr:LPS export ABC transporter periplasmic protein LptC [uncultured Luteimonas sp.]
MNWRLWIILALLAGALLSGWFAWRGDDADAPAEGGEGLRSDYILRDFEVVTLDSTGQESFSLRAPELHQTPGARTLELATPLFLMPDQHGSRWEVRARTGWVNEKSTLVQLRGDVVADSPMGASRPTVLRTEQLDVHPEENRATSEAVVTITTPGTTMRGTGMEADLASKRIQLLSKVSLNNDPTRR